MSQKASQADSFLSLLLLFARWKEFARLSRLGPVRGSLFLPCWPWGESENVGPKSHVITVGGCDVPNARVGVFMARPMDLSLASQKSSTSQRIPFSRPFDLIVASRECGVQRTRTLYFVDFSIGICLDCDASFGFDIDMGFWDIGISLKALVSVCERG